MTDTLQFKNNVGETYNANVICGNVELTKNTYEITKKLFNEKTKNVEIIPKHTYKEESLTIFLFLVSDCFNRLFTFIPKTGSTQGIKLSTNPAKNAVISIKYTFLL